MEEQGAQTLAAYLKSEHRDVQFEAAVSNQKRDIFDVDAISMKSQVIWQGVVGRIIPQKNGVKNRQRFELQQYYRTQALGTVSWPPDHCSKSQMIGMTFWIL